ncbi:phosphorylase [Striga asiatica]|uniref:Phosphorylase n=1 Tax=Striga asiatica TaxID=4170 RepID=A0A5A7R293_STRAF|nr:phosphorylase [Striga asiatica]
MALRKMDSNSLVSFSSFHPRSSLLSIGPQGEEEGATYPHIGPGSGMKRFGLVVGWHQEERRRGLTRGNGWSKKASESYLALGSPNSSLPTTGREPSQKESLSIGDPSLIHWRKSMPGETIGGRPIKLSIKDKGFANL